MPVEAPSVDPGLLQGLFDLTPAEARIAKGIVGGQSLKKVASAHGISGETARSQLKSVLAKTGTHRQSEFVALIAPAWIQPGFGPPRRRCFVNQWGELICRRRRLYY